MNYDSLVTTALEQIADKGRTVTLRSVGEGAFNPATMTFTGGANSDRSVKAVFTSFKTAEIDGSIILQGDKKVLIADIESRPDNTDILVDGDDEYKILNVETVQPGDTPLLYKLQVRR